MIKIYDCAKIEKSEIFSRMAEKKPDVSGTVTEIIENVKANGDAALREYSLKFDKAELGAIEVSGAEFDEAIASVSEDFLRVIKRAEANIRRFHEKQKRYGFVLPGEDGTVLGQRIIPIEKAGIYVPGGTAAYPSTVLMDSVPAKIAGVGEIVMVTPPGKDGKVAAPILAAAKIAGVDRVFKIGGAQAIAALAYGTETVPRVDKIVGPGNAFVAEAKRQVYGLVSIDMIAGPSEILIVSDGKSNPEYVAADLLSQAEHDKNASAVLVTDSMELAKKVQLAVDSRLKKLLRSEIAEVSIENNGKIIVAENLDAAIEIANALAPEHLELCLDNPFDYLYKVKHAGSIFMGRNCPEALGDYLAGPNHTLPTSGTARFSSPLSVDDFIKKSQFIYYSVDAFRDVARDVDLFARAEGLTGHGESATVRLEGLGI
ncbi:MAG: histidinol dehydrogenase [Oscillospiraceae bacterium]|nr:histidinol dehydrogenase [Oscillospiraceae bacterium]